jgi:hypothetical protein
MPRLLAPVSGFCYRPTDSRPRSPTSSAEAAMSRLPFLLTCHPLRICGSTLDGKSARDESERAMIQRGQNGEPTIQDGPIHPCHVRIKKEGAS